MESLLLVRIIFVSLNIFLVFGSVAVAILASSYDGILSVGQLFFAVVTIITNLGLGFCANIKKISFVLWIYIALMSVLLAVDLIFAVVFHAANPIWMGAAILQAQWNSPLYGESRMNAFQAEHKCCGIYAADDFVKNKMNLPASCYAQHHHNETNSLFEVGCVYKIQPSVIKYLAKMAVISWCSFSIKIAIIVCAAIMVAAFSKMEKNALKV